MTFPALNLENTARKKNKIKNYNILVDKKKNKKIVRPMLEWKILNDKHAKCADSNLPSKQQYTSLV
jgi:hypothetical protein